MDATLTDDFAASMAALGPFEGKPRLAAGVSGGADSMALAFLADRWVRERGGSLVALVVDHGLRPESTDEAALTISRLADRGISVRLLKVTGLRRGSALAARARAARYDSLTEACADSGIVHLLLGHHAADQAETMMIRVLSGSSHRGLAGMSALTETRSLRVLRPLLTIPPARLRRFLTNAGITWVEDPSNVDMRALRPRLRKLRADPGGESEGTCALAAAARSAGHQRMMLDDAMARSLASRVTMRPEGFALLSPGPIAPGPLAELLRVISGAAFAPSMDQVAPVASKPSLCTLGGVRLVPAGRLGDGLTLIREEAAIGASVSAGLGVTWDGRFRFVGDHQYAHDMTIGAVGDDAARLRAVSDLPSAVLRTLPALRRGNILVSVPHLLYPDAQTSERVKLLFSPYRPLAGAPFLPAQ